MDDVELSFRCLKIAGYYFSKFIDRFVVPVPTPTLNVQKVETGLSEMHLAREATQLLREFSTPRFGLALRNTQ